MGDWEIGPPDDSALVWNRNSLELNTPARTWPKIEFSLGGFRLTILPEDENLPLQLPETYRPFVVDDQVGQAQAAQEIVLRACYRATFEANLEQVLFTSGENWTLGRWKDRRVLLKFLSNGRIHQALILDPDLSTGTIYCVGERWLEKETIFYPLTYPMDMLLMIQLLGQHGGYLFHAAGVIHEGKAILFVGRSGAGKSTTSKLWLNRPGVTLLNDDRVIVRRREGQFRAFGNPWHGEVSAVSADSALLERIYLLKHGSQNCVTALKPVEAVSRLLSCSFPTYWDAQGMGASLQDLDELVHSVPCFELAFLPDERVVDFVQCL